MLGAVVTTHPGRGGQQEVRVQSGHQVGSWVEINSQQRRKDQQLDDRSGKCRTHASRKELCLINVIKQRKVAFINFESRRVSTF